MTEVKTPRFDIEGAARIGIPKGDDRDPCVAAFQEATGIEVPGFNGRQLRAVSQGIEFFLLKGKDIPGFADTGAIDLGVAGTDSIREYSNQLNLQARKIGEAMCTFTLMCLAGKEEDLRGVLTPQPRWQSGRRVPTPLPSMLMSFASQNNLPLIPAVLPNGATISGSIEIMPYLLNEMGVEMVADRVESGQTARENGLAELAQIEDIYPALIRKMPDEDI